MSLQRRAASVMRLYHRLDVHTRSFRAASGLECLPGCGSCCLSAEVEATVLEMLPAAFQLQREGRLEQTLAALARPPATCALYAAGALALTPGTSAAAGHCRLYSHRALLCRLFGFAARLDRSGNRELATCRLIREARPELAARAAEAVREGSAVIPVMRNYQMQLYGIDPSLGARLLPINLALAQALEMVGFSCRWRVG